jgi:hypothetical protein
LECLIGASETNPHFENYYPGRRIVKNRESPIEEKDVTNGSEYLSVFTNDNEV